MGKREQQQQNKRSFEQVESGDDSVVDIKQEQNQLSNNNSTTTNNSNNNTDTNNNGGKNNTNQQNNMKKQQEQVHVKEEEEFEDAEQDDDQEDEEEVVEEEEEIEEEVEEDEEEEEDDEDGEEKHGNKSNAGKSSTNQSSQGARGANANQGSDKRPRLTDELYEMNLRRKKEHVGSALYIPFPRKVTEEEVRAFVGQGPNIFLVGPQKQNAIVRYRTQVECEKQQKELAKQEFAGQTLAIEPKTVKIDPANIDVKTLIVQYSNPDLSIMDFAQIFIKAISISLKGGKSKKESQEDLSFGSAIIIFPSHDEAKEAFLATENLNIKGEQLRVVFADFRPGAGSSTRTSSSNFGFRSKGGDSNRGSGDRGGNYNRGGNQGGGRSGGNFRNRNRNSGNGSGGGGGGGGGRNFGNRNFNQNSGGGGGGGGGYNQGGGNRNYSPNKKFRSNVRS